MRARQEEVCQRESRKRRGREGRVGCAARAVGAAPCARGVGGVGSEGVRARAGGLTFSLTLLLTMLHVQHGQEHVVVDDLLLLRVRAGGVVGGGGGGGGGDGVQHGHEWLVCGVQHDVVENLQVHVEHIQRVVAVHGGGVWHLRVRLSGARRPGARGGRVILSARSRGVTSRHGRRGWRAKQSCASICSREEVFVRKGFLSG